MKHKIASSSIAILLVAASIIDAPGTTRERSGEKTKERPGSEAEDAETTKRKPVSTKKDPGGGGAKERTGDKLDDRIIDAANVFTGKQTLELLKTIAWIAYGRAAIILLDSGTKTPEEQVADRIKKLQSQHAARIPYTVATISQALSNEHRELMKLTAKLLSTAEELEQATKTPATTQTTQTTQNTRGRNTNQQTATPPPPQTKELVQLCRAQNAMLVGTVKNKLTVMAPVKLIEEQHLLAMQQLDILEAAHTPKTPVQKAGARNTTTAAAAAQPPNQIQQMIIQARNQLNQIKLQAEAIA
ncbi:MAG: hypothetical protein LBD43_00920 [Holosporales bacterium]|jgi:hypothetical protein|nr:hypothetical protein [Holosporales bacterium]